MNFSFFNFCNDFLGDYHFLLLTEASAFLLKIVYFLFFLKKLIAKPHIPRWWHYFWIILLSSAMEDFSWIISLLSKTFFPFLMGAPCAFFISLGWASNIVMYQILSLFIEDFVSKKQRVRWYHYLFIPTSSTFFFFFVAKAFMFSGELEPLKTIMQQAQSQYVLLVLLPFTIIHAFSFLRDKQLPRILDRQLKVIVHYFLVPHLVASLFQVYPFTFISGGLANNLAAVSISTIFLSLALFYCIKKIMGLRFLNIHNHVHVYDPYKFNFINDFKETLEALGKAGTLQEIRLITQHFFNVAFTIPASSTALYIRALTSEDTSIQEVSERETTIDHFVSKSGSIVDLRETKIFIRDEIEYNNYLQKTMCNTLMLSFLDSINADIFIPIYHDTLMVAAVVVEKRARQDHLLYNNIERDEMLVFTSYLPHIIFLMQNRNLPELLKQRKDNKDELYFKHQEINQYKESLHAFLKTYKENEIGILFYKNKKFTFGNQEAEKLVSCDPNVKNGEPLVQTFHLIAHQVELYKTTQSLIAKDSSGNKLLITALTHPEKGSIIFIIHRPAISDVIKHLINYVKEPSDWDYVLYLETTESGKLINNLIPGSGETLLNFKVNLLKLALSRKAILLTMPEQDLDPTAELIHHLSLRDILYVLDLKPPATNNDISFKLFGINPLFGSPTVQPIFEKLDKKGTLFIKNIHLLDRETQELLASYIRYGFYTVCKSDKRVQAEVRIICSTHHNLENLVEKDVFSAALYQELYTASLVLPSPMTLPPQEVETLISGYSEQAIAGTSLAHIKMFTLNEKDKERILENNPVSLLDLKIRVQQLLITKTYKGEVIKDSQFTAAHLSSDPRIIEAARLGKHALKDRQTLTLLWEKFQNQNKIAQFLGVNRSSVNRRGKEFGIF